jgi:heme/copper-type cytochrome/quinol oxidase subunit 3
MTDTVNRSKGYSETPEEKEFELRAQVGSLWSGGRLFIGMYTFLLASLAFSYFYLRSSNNGLLWRPNNVTAPTSYGWAIYSLELMAALLAIFGQLRLRKGQVLDWQVAIWTGVGAGLVALFLQIWEFTALPFYPGSSGYASTFIGWSVINIITLCCGTYWLETTVARSLRMRKEIGGVAPVLSMHPSAQLFRSNVASMTYFWGFVALSGTLFLAMFYVL